MACCRYRVLHQRPDRCQQRAGVLCHIGYTRYPRLPHARRLRACRSPWAQPRCAHPHAAADAIAALVDLDAAA